MPLIGAAKAKKSEHKKSHVFLTLVIIGSVVFAILLGLSRMPDPNEQLAREKAQMTADSNQIISTDQIADPNSNVAPLTLIHNRLDIAHSLEEYANTYSQRIGQPIKIITISGNTDYQQTLQKMQDDGELPDLFLLERPEEFDAWKDLALDLKTESWAQNTNFAFQTSSGEVLGFPTAIEGYGLVYNLDLLVQAGINPAQLNNFTSLQSACYNLNAKKEELGIDSVFAMSVSTENGMDWISDLANFNTYLSSGLNYGNTMVLDQVKQGQSEVSRLSQYAQFVQLIFNNTNQSLLKQGTYTDQVQAFANGKAVFIQDTQWLDPTLDSLGVTFDRGFAPIPAYLPITNGIFVKASGWYVINAKSKHLQAAKQFLRDLAETTEGNQFMIEQAGLIPAFNTLKVEPQQPLAKSLWQWAKAGKIYSIWSDELPADFASKKLSPAFEQLASGTINTETFASLLAEAIRSLNPNPDPTALTMTEASAIIH